MNQCTGTEITDTPIKPQSVIVNHSWVDVVVVGFLWVFVLNVINMIQYENNLSSDCVAIDAPSLPFIVHVT